MELDYLLFALGGVLGGLFLFLLSILVRTRKRSKEYSRTLRSITERTDIVGTIQKTESISMGHTSQLFQQTDSLENKTAGAEATEALSDSERIMSDMESSSAQTGELQADTPEAELVGAGLDLRVLEEKYVLLRELGGGNMSRVFLAMNLKLGNEWIIKYLDGSQASLAEEAEVLKTLNHISLPQIIDIIQQPQGTFIVERYIEGYSLEDVMRRQVSLDEVQIQEWGLQIAQVLRYLHGLDTPIIHCDLKPGNIIVTHDNRLVLIDFGISKRQGTEDGQKGITLEYAAPEQFTGKLMQRDIVRERFGTLGAEQAGWKIDQRTDIYSTGVILFALLTGNIPTLRTLPVLDTCASREFAEVIRKCLAVEPGKRYQSAGELEKALLRVQAHRVVMARRLALRRVAAVCCGVSLVGSLSATASAAYVNRLENLSAVEMDPCRTVISAQQSVQLLIQKIRPGGESVTLDPSRIQWSYSEDNIARLDGDRLVGFNPGETTLYGKYRNKVITLDVTVTEPLEEVTQVALRYPDGVQVERFAGSGERDRADGSAKLCAFISPESLASDADALYISDSGTIRILEDGEVGTLALEPEYLTADLIRPMETDIYVLTGPWEDDEGESWYGFLRIGEEGAEVIYYTEAVWSTISDFAFDSGGRLWFIQQNISSGTTSLNTLDVTTQECAWVMDLPEGTRNMTFDESDTLYLSVPESGVLLRVERGEETWTYFAGLEGERHFIDGAIPEFYRPASLAAQGEALYVLDFDTVRKVSVEGSGARFTETLAGIPTEETNPQVVLGDGRDTVLPASELAAIALDGEGRLLLSDPKNSVIYEIEMEK